ncbi:MAG: hypothetical protein DDT38_01324 [Firmicutes bacterium]|nr:hypothetical protein [candidate division NPL-UPA2 bacterium]
MNKTLGPAVTTFFAGNLRHIKGAFIGRSFELESWQQEMLDLIFELNGHGRRKWRSVLLGMPRGNGKSPLAAGIALFEMITRRDAPDVYCAAASRDQAGIVHEFAHGMPRDGPLVDFLHFPKSKTSPIVCTHNNGRMRVLSADGDLQYGLSVSIAVIDELHAFKTNKQEELFFALTTATQKRDQSITFIITTAGASKTSLLGEKFDAMIKTHKLEYSSDGCMVIGKNEDAGSLLIWIGAPDAADVSDHRIWRACNPATWIPLSEMERLASEVPESVFRRLVLNQWVLGSDAAIQPSSWDACCSPAVARIEEGADVWAAVDIGEKRDTSAIVIVSPIRSGELRIAATIYDPARENVKTLLPLVEAEIRRLAGTYTLRGVGFDPWQFRRSAELLASEGIRMIEVPQIERHMVPASQWLYDYIEQRRLFHDGDMSLRRHILAAEAKQTSRGTWRLAKPLQSHGRRTDETQKVDAAIALAMAVAAHTYDEKAGGELWATQW